MKVSAIGDTWPTRTNPDSDSPLALILGRSGMPEATVSVPVHPNSGGTEVHLKPDIPDAAKPRRPDPTRGIVYVVLNERWKTERQSPLIPIPATAYAWAQEGDEEWTYL